MRGSSLLLWGSLGSCTPSRPSTIDATETNNTSPSPASQTDTAIKPTTFGDTTADSSATTPATPTCGDGLIEADEICDEGRNNGNGGFCRDNCQTNVCGDGYLGPGEICDDGNTDDADRCTNACELASCGDGQLQAGEKCDEGRDNSQTGACLTSCLDASCGDQLIHVGVEACDGDNLGASTCGTEGFDGGVLVCSSDCSTLDTSACFICGDGIVEIGVEECDGIDLGGATCDSLPGTPFGGGALACDNASCTFDTSDCCLADGQACTTPDECCSNVCDELSAACQP